MNDVMLPWPRPRRPGQDNQGNKADQTEQTPDAPRYEIQRVDGPDATGPVEVLPITGPPWSAAPGRRGLLGAGIASSVAAALLLGGCDDGGSESPSSPSPTHQLVPDSESIEPLAGLLRHAHVGGTADVSH